MAGEDDKKHVEVGGEQVHGSGVTPWGVEIIIDLERRKRPRAGEHARYRQARPVWLLFG